MNLLPREEKFYKSLNKQVEYISEAAYLLLEGAKSGNARMVANALKIKDLEERGDEVIHEIYTKLNQTFITPLDPEDIHSLATHLDDILDGIEEVAYRIPAYQIDPIPCVAVTVCQAIVSCADQLKTAFEALSQDRKLLEPCIEINRIEDDVDNIVRNAVKELFERETNPIQIMKLKEIFELLEQTTDYCEDVADALQNVIVKNS